MIITSIERVNTDSEGRQAVGHSLDTLHSSISANGRWIVFESDAANLVYGDNNKSTDVYLKDAMTDRIVAVSINSNGEFGNNDSYQPSISPDGNVIVFPSKATNFFADTNSRTDVFSYSRLDNGIDCLSLSANGTQANGNSVSVFDTVISADNRYVVFESGASNLIAGDTNGTADIFMRDLATDKIVRVSVSDSGAQANGFSSHASITADGSVVAFQSLANNLVANDKNNKRDVFVRDMETGDVVCVSTDNKGALGNNESKYPTLSANGRFAAFQSAASNLVDGDKNGKEDVFLKDLITGETFLVSVGLDGQSAAAGSSLKPRLSSDGRFVFFHSDADDLVANYKNNVVDIFVRDMATGETFVVSTGPDAEKGNGRSTRANVSDDGSVVIFESLASNLVANDTNGDADLFMVKLDWPQLIINGNGGNNVLAGSAYGERIAAGAGNDRVSADWGNDTVNGDDGDDTLAGGDGDDVLSGNVGRDTISDGAGLDSFYGGTEADRFVLTPNDGKLDIIWDFAASEGDKIDLSGFPGITLADVKVAGGILSVKGEQVVRIVGEFDAGRDLVFTDGTQPPPPPGTGETWTGTMDADNHGGTAGSDSLMGLGGDDTLTGGAGNDTIKGCSGDDEIAGGGGDDFLSGNAGRDTITDGAGLDSFYGGTEADRFVLTPDDGQLDGIWDFTASDGDRVDLTLFSGITHVSFEGGILTVDGEDVVKIVGDFSLDHLIR